MTYIQIGKWNKVDNEELVRRGRKRRLNFELVEKDGKFEQYLRCPVCGKDMTHDFVKDKKRLLELGLWSIEKDRPFHCSRQFCKDWWFTHEVHNPSPFEVYYPLEKKKRLKQARKKVEWDLFKNLKKKGVVR